MAPPTDKRSQDDARRRKTRWLDLSAGSGGFRSKRTQSVERAKGLHGGSIALANDVLELCDYAEGLRFHKQSLGFETPQEILMGKSCHERAGVAGIEAGISVIGSVVEINAIDAATAGVAQRGFVSTAAARFGINASGSHTGYLIMLDENIVLIADPDHAIGSCFREHRGRPPIAAVKEVVRKLLCLVSGSLAGNRELSDEFACRLADKRVAIPPRFGKALGFIECMAGTFESLESFHHRMIRRGDRGPEHLAAMRLESPARQPVSQTPPNAETSRRSVDRQKCATVLHIA